MDADRGFTLLDNTRGSDAYTANQSVVAGFAMVTLPIFEPLELMGGVRVERSVQQVDTFDPFVSDPDPVTGRLVNTDWLPAVTATWRLNDAMNLRGGYGRTVSRPDFRELSEAIYRDVITSTSYIGNPDLDRATIENFDVRWEWYLTADELLSIGAFVKVFDQPIEQVDRGGVERSVTWDNADRAQNLGLEFEARRRLSFLSDSLESLYVATNAAWIRSRVTLGDAARASTSTERALQGQSPFIVNAQIGIDDTTDAGSGITAALVYNVAGRRISDVGRLRAPDTFEEPFHQVDLIYGHELGAGLAVSLKAQNLIDHEQRFTQGERVRSRFRRGRDFSIGASWSY
jgi:TonB-dependent receptor